MHSGRAHVLEGDPREHQAPIAGPPSLADGGEGVQIFIGADNELFNVTGCSIIIAPYQSSHHSLVGAIGVIGPTRMNYARIIPMVDYTAKLIGDAIS